MKSERRRSTGGRSAALGAWISVLCAAVMHMGGFDSAPARAQDVPPATPAPQGVDYDLAGASQVPEDPDVDFVEAWRPVLHEVAVILSAPGAERFCVEVQGQHDDHRFSAAVERSLGGQRAAQLDRARGRSQAVVSELDAMGVPYQRIRHRPPSIAPSYRGVRLRILPECIEAAATATTLPEWMSTPESIATALDEVSARRAALVAQSASTGAAPTAPVDTGPEAKRGPFSMDGSMGFGLMVSTPSDAISFAVRAGLGWGEKKLYVRARVGVGTSDQLEQRAFFEWGASIGSRPRPWLRVGLSFLSRLATYRLDHPWFEQSWFLGIESEQRVVDFGPVSLWVGETIHPLGLRTRRGTVENGQIVNSPDRIDYAARFEVQLIVRGHFARGRGLAGSP